MLKEKQKSHLDGDPENVDKQLTAFYEIEGVKNVGKLICSLLYRVISRKPAASFQINAVNKESASEIQLREPAVLK